MFASTAKEVADEMARMPDGIRGCISANLSAWRVIMTGLEQTDSLKLIPRFARLIRYTFMGLEMGRAAGAATRRMLPRPDWLASSEKDGRHSSTW